MPVRERMAQKFGPEREAAITQRLATMGKGEGICFTFSGKMGNTRDAHRLVQLARIKGGDTQDRLMSAMMRGYFEQGGDITSREELTAAAVEAGIKKEEASSWLEDGKGGEEVDREVEWAYAKGISGVPHFIVNDKYEISGAQDVEAFVAELVRAKGSA